MHPFAALQHLLPQHGLSRLLGFCAASRQPLAKRILIESFKAAYNVDMRDFQGDGAADYESFNDFFTRPLRPGARPLPAAPDALACPADGVVSQAGRIERGRLLQAKGRDYAVADLLGGDGGFAASLEHGAFATIYLAPRDYHRVHAPAAGELIESVAVPGRLFSVNALTERHVPRLFARNERLVLRIRAAFGDYALVLVGAMVVASIRAAWPNGPASPYRGGIRRQRESMTFERGEEVGAFLVGSTVVALFPPDAVEMGEEIAPGAAVRVRGCMGKVRISRRGAGAAGTLEKS